jgi:hypothetical protein
MKLISNHAASIAARTVVVLALGSVAALVYAAGESLSGPSIAKAREPITFSGSSFTAGQALSVVVTAPSGAQAVYGAVASAEGKLNYQFVPTEVGVYAISVVAASNDRNARSPGASLASARVVAQP